MTTRTACRNLRSRPLLALIILCLASGCTDSDSPAPTTPAVAKNVVLISIDTCRADHLSCYGFGKNTTPNIDAVAADGVLFTRAQTTNPTTLPAHCSLFTGTLPTVHGVRDNYHYRLSDSAVTLAEVFQEQGYETAAFLGAFPLDAKFGLSQGFDTYDDAVVKRGRYDVAKRKAADVTRAARQWLDARDEKPFFLFLHYFDPHQPLQPPEPFASQFPEDPYAAEIASTDHSIGKIIEQLKAAGLYDSTTIIITSDHGEGLRQHNELTHSFFVYQSTIHIPLVIKAPGSLKNVKVDETVSIIDIFPTILSIHDFAVPPAVQGLDLTETLNNSSAATLDRVAYSESLLPTAFEGAPLRAVVDKNWHYIWTVRPELYDLDTDPREENDLIDQKPELARQLRAKLQNIATQQVEFMQPAEAPSLGEEDAARLRQLGYVGGAIRDEVAEDLTLSPAMKDPKDVVKLYQLLMQCESLFGKGRVDEAQRLGVILLRKNPSLYKTNVLMAKMAHSKKQPQQAIQYYKKALESLIKIEERSSQAYRGVSREITDVRFSLGFLLRKRGRLADARKQFQQLVNDYPDEARMSSNLGGILVEIAGTARTLPERQKLVAEAKTLLQNALRMTPRDADTMVNLAAAHVMVGELEEAKKQFIQAIAIDPKNAAARTNLQRIRDYEKSQRSQSGSP